jgi:hypothetical protein
VAMVTDVWVSQEQGIFLHQLIKKDAALTNSLVYVMKSVRNCLNQVKYEVSSRISHYEELRDMYRVPRAVRIPALIQGV